jgi:hypothetical protein
MADKTHMKTVRLTDEENNDLKTLSKSMDLSDSNVIRRLIHEAAKEKDLKAGVKCVGERYVENIKYLKYLLRQIRENLPKDIKVLVDTLERELGINHD